MSPIFSICWIILSMQASNPSMELGYSKTVLVVRVVYSCVFQSMEHICDRNWLMQWMIINLVRFLVASSKGLDQTSIVQDNFHLKWRRDQRIQLLILRSNTCPIKILHDTFEIPCIYIQYMSKWLSSCCIISIYH